MSFFKYYLGPTVAGVAWDPVWGEMHREAAMFDAMIASDVESANDLDKLQRRVAKQARQLEELSATVAVLLRMLGEAKHVDLEILEHRIDAEVELRRAPPDPVPGTCALCGRDRKGEQLSKTAYGLACTPSCDAIE
ncbi:MAG: hypothetical protein JNL83_08255 [Myxococcales bacterium]|nr:hypothetical protein [Myxococcales bacterium]